MRAWICCLFLVSLLNAQTIAPREERLWRDGPAPGALGVDEQTDIPTLTTFLPIGFQARTGVVVCPGGGYGHLALDHEGKQIAEWLNDRGIAAFVLKYRLGPRYHHPAPLLDAQRAVRMVRSRASEFGILPDRIGMWGFSAGGHLTATVGTHFDQGQPSAPDALDRQPSRPDFLILAYPVITLLPPYAHSGSRTNLLGNAPDQRMIELLSNETQVTAATPPSFLFHTTTDATVPVENSIRFYEALRKKGVPAELHVYEVGKHGVGLAKADPILSTWPGRLEDWMRLHGLLTPPALH